MTGAAGPPGGRRSRRVPAGTTLVLLPGTERPRPGVVTGGTPWRLLRVTARADRHLDRWAAGEGVPDDPAARSFAGRLVDTGMATVRAGDPGEDASVAVVIPVRDQPAGLASTLAALGPGVAVVVVDDGSTDDAAVRAACGGRAGTRLLRRAAAGGPAAARNAGWRDVDTAIVAFLDAECLPPWGWLAELVGLFSDPAVAAVAPRVRGVPSRGGPRWLAAYEACRFPLDLGPVGGRVRPRSRVPYVPSAALLVRRSALDAVGGFDEARRTGEDVDLVWRLDEAGWRVYYDPSVVVSHPIRPTLRSWAGQRTGYGRSAAPLAARHGDAVAPLVMDRATAAAWGLAGAGRPRAGLLVAAVSGAALARPLGRGTSPALPGLEVVRLVVAGQAAGARSLAAALRRPWWPLLAGAAVASRRARRMALAAAAVPPVVSWYRERPDLDLLRWSALSLADDVAYGAGVWAGAWRQRSARCLVPALTGGPPARRRPAKA